MKFVIKKAKNGQFMFNLVSGNGQIVATSEQYTEKASAKKTIESIMKGAAGAKIVDESAM